MHNTTTQDLLSGKLPTQHLDVKTIGLEMLTTNSPFKSKVHIFFLVKVIPKLYSLAPMKKLYSLAPILQIHCAITLQDSRCLITNPLFKSKVCSFIW